MDVHNSPQVYIWNRKRILFGLLLLAGSLLAIAAACDMNKNEDLWMGRDPKDCTCQGTTLHCDQQGTDDFPNSKYCDQAGLNKAGLCSCNGTTLTCGLAVAVSFAKNSTTPTASISTPGGPTPSSDNWGYTGPAVLTFPNSSGCGGTQQATEAPTQPVNESTATATNVPVSTQGSPQPPACTPNPGDGICSACENTDIDSASCVCNMNGVCDPHEGFNCPDCQPTAVPGGGGDKGGGRKKTPCPAGAVCP